MSRTGRKINPTRLGLRSLSVAVLALVLLPLAIPALSWLGGVSEYWQHFGDTRLLEVTVNTLVLVAVVVAGALALGAFAALATQLLEFPGRRWIATLLPIPLALPAYVPAFIYAGLAQTVQGRIWLPGLREHWGVFFVMTLVLYPYVYLLVSAALRAGGTRQIEAARMLGLSYPQAVWRVIVPSLRTALLASGVLVALETLADFGAVAIFSYDTYTTVIFSAWHGLFNFSAASQVASLLLLVAGILLLGERAVLPARQTQQSSDEPTRRHRLTGIWRWGIPILLSVFLGFALLLPLAQLLAWSLPNFSKIHTLLPSVVQTLVLAVGAGAIVMIFALLLALGARRLEDSWANFAVRCTLLSYGIPGAVLAVGLLVLYAWVGLQGTVVGLLLAYCVRFAAPGLRALDGALARIGMHHEEMARTLGASGFNLLRRVWLPLLASPAGLALLLVVVEVIKEMPVTLLLRPFGWDTLAVQIYQLTSEGLWTHAALPALLLLLLGAGPAIWLQSVRNAGTLKVLITQER